MPKSWGVWGFQHLGFFNIYLCAKSLCRGLMSSNLWCKIINSKYTKRLPPSSWMCTSNFSTSQVSAVWCSLCSALPCILRDLCWKVGRGNNISLDMESIVGIDNVKFSRTLLACLHAKNITVLKHTSIDCEDPSSGWLSAQFLGLFGVVAKEWDDFTT